MEHRTVLGLFLALAVNRPAAAFGARASLSSSGRHTAAAPAAAAAATSSTASTRAKRPAACSLAVENLVDVDANLLHPNLVDDIDNHLQVATNVCILNPCGKPYEHSQQQLCCGLVTNARVPTTINSCTVK